MKKLITIALVFICFSSVTSAQNSDNRLYDLNDDIDYLRKAYNAVGLSVVIVENDKIIYSKGFGKRNLEHNLLMDANTLLPIGSSTKSFTAALVGIIESKGLISIKNRPKAYLPQIEFNTDLMNNLITIEDLLSHKSGIGNLDGSEVFFPSINNDDFTNRYKFLKPNATVRNSFSYSNASYGIAGHIIEEVTGKSWETNLKVELFKPLNMNHTITGVEHIESSSNYALGYGNYKGDSKKVPYFKFGYIKPGGDIISTANDMGNWLITWLNGGSFKGDQVIPEDFVKQSLSLQNILPQDNSNPNSYLFGYGFGWFVQSKNGEYFAQHGGNTSGFSTQMAIYPHKKIGIAVLTNQHSSALAYNIEDIISKRMLNLPRKPIEDYKIQVSEIYQIPKENKSYKNFEPEPYIGTYYAHGYGKVKVFKKDNRLFAKFPAYTFELIHQNKDAFIMEATTENSQYFNPNFKVNFKIDNRTRIKAFSIQLQSEPVKFKKV